MWQTPTQLTYEILNDTDSFKCPVDIDGIPERYKDFVNEKSKDEVGKFYQPHTLIANEHLNELKAWLFRMKEQDFKVSWRMG